jgi:hypothetical protein
MKTFEKSKIYQASPEEVFNYLDDLGVTGMHMTQSSMPMMGGKMNLEYLSKNKTGLGTKYRWTGKILWMVLDFTVQVTNWVKGREKIWETVGAAQMIIYSWFRMHLNVDKVKEGSMAHLSISYKRPKGFFERILSFFLADWYCKWCMNNMLRDTEKKLRTPSDNLQVV